MRAIKIPNLSQQVIVWTTVRTLEELMTIAYWSDIKQIITDYNMIDSIDIYVEWAVRYSSSATPTLTSWMWLPAFATRTFRGVSPSKLYLIAVADTKLNIQLGTTHDL